MNTASLKKIVSLMSSWKDSEKLLLTVDVLLILIKKFGKQMSQQTIIDFLQKNYPDVYGLYILLWWPRCSVRVCLLLRKYLREEIGEQFLVAHSSHVMVETLLKDIDQNIHVEISWDGSNPVLNIQSPTRTYRRSLQDDLTKVI